MFLAEKTFLTNDSNYFEIRCKNENKLRVTIRLLNNSKTFQVDRYIGILNPKDKFLQYALEIKFSETCYLNRLFDVTAQDFGK